MSVRPPDPALQNPIIGTTIDTSPQTLGLLDERPRTPTSPPTTSIQLSSSARLTTSPKSVIKRTVETTAATAAKLSGSVLGTGKKDRDGQQWARSSAVSPSRSSGPRRFLSLSRKGKGKDLGGSTTGEPSGANGDGQYNDRTAPQKRPMLGPSRSSSPSTLQTTRTIRLQSGDDSPFIRPRTPTPPPSSRSMMMPQRPSMDAIKDFGSMRAGTQTLIQAIQAMPWTDEPEGDDEAIPPTAINSDSSDDETPGQPLASSIHTIYRPIARSRRQDSVHFDVGTAGISKGKSLAPIESSEGEEGEEEQDSVSDDDEDFETTPIDSRNLSASGVYPPHREDAVKHALPESVEEMVQSRRLMMTRSASLATVRIKRRARLAEKLREVFGLSDINEVVAELPCWLLRSVLLQGYMYLTNSHLCFFAHMPAREDQVLKSGSLNKKTQRTKRWLKHWFVLKNDVLSWYQSSSDPYFPHGVIDLRYAISCDAMQDKMFRIRTNQKIVTLMADSVPSREEWVKAIRKVMFKAQNMGNSVKIAIPYSVIEDVDKSSAMDFSETIEVKVDDVDESLQTDSYFFAYFQNINLALEQIRDAVRTYKPAMQASITLPEVQDTTGLRMMSLPERTQSSPPAETTPPSRSSYGLRLASLLRPFQSDTGSGMVHSTSVRSNEFTHVSKPSGTITTSPQSMTPRSASQTLPAPAEHVMRTTSDGPLVVALKGTDHQHTYPPPPSPSAELNVISNRESSFTSAWSVPAWLKGPGRRVFNIPSASTSGATIGRKGVQETVSAVTPSSSRSADAGSSDFGFFSVLDASDALDAEIVEKFRQTFAFDEKENLSGYFQGYLFRLLPTYGKLYISTNFFCFKSSGPLATRTRMVLPIKDILAAQKTKAYRFGHHGLVIIIKGHEELFFEFGNAERREAFVNLLERQVEESRRQLALGDVQLDHNERNEALGLEELEPSGLLDNDKPRPPPESLADSLPAVMFTSQSSTFLSFKPERPMHITCLTIGSRGDVQPYIALAKGLMADGHKVRIATHGEFKEWIESHGIEFGYVGGDPAELMRICVENGMFTVSFFKEGIQKFRGWVDDLFKTSWEACQGTDLLIESPSAMGGLHIAEALAIPYYRAFTMTWTRTRAYPHAFAVPEHKMGGGYNYMSYVMFDQVFWRAIAGQVNRFRRNTLHLPSTNLDRMEPHKVPFLYNFSPSIVPPPLDWPEWIRITGYWFLDDAEVSATKWQPPKSLEDFLASAHDANRKVVYIGFGSIVVSDPDAMTRCVIEAIKASGVYAILSKGWSDRLHAKKGADATAEPEVPLPPQIYSIKSLPHDWLFKRIDAACHHGGAGTTGASLRAGIPTIVKPFFGDQFFWGDRVEALGVGSCVRKLTVESLADALIQATTNEKQIDRARILGEQIRSENGVATAIESIYRDLEYARSLVKHHRTGGGDMEDEDEDDGTIRVSRPLINTGQSSQSTPERGAGSTESCTDSAHGAPSEDWSIISDNDDGERTRRSSRERRNSSPTANKRSGIAAAVLSVLPDSLSHSRGQTRA